LATYILLRGITLLIRTGNKPRAAARHPLLHAALAPTRLAHGDTLLMCVAASQIVYAFIMMPQTLPPSYVRFIRKQGAKELYVWRGVRVRLQATMELLACMMARYVMRHRLLAYTSHVCPVLTPLNV
jgi:hypothetical protein